MKKLFPLYMLLITTLALSAQQKVAVHIDYSNLLTLETNHNQTLHYFSFPEATNLPEYGALPIFMMDVELPSNVFECEAKLSDIEIDTLDNATMELLSDKELCPLDFTVLVEQAGNRARIFVVPFSTNESRTAVFRLLKAQLLIDFSPVEPGNLQLIEERDYVDNSVLSSGTWYKLGITHRGVCRLDAAFFENLGIDIASLDPSKLGVFGNYSGMLRETNAAQRIDDLQENAIRRVGMEDGTFDQDDYILFYTEGPTAEDYNVFSMHYNHVKNLYADTIYYFVTTDRATGLEMNSLPISNMTPTLTIDEFLDVQSHELDLENLLDSGKEWYGESFTGDTMERVFHFNFPHLVQGFPVHLLAKMAARGFVYTYFELSVNGQQVIDSTLFLKVTASSHTYAFKAQKTASFFADNDQLEVKIRYISDDENATAWLDNLELNVKRELIFTGGQMVFRQPDAAVSGQIARFNVRNVNQDVEIWGITSPHFPQAIDFQKTNDVVQFTLDDAQERDFIIFDGNSYVEPVDIHEIPNQNLHAISNLNMIIVAPDMFLDQANRLAQIHETVDNLKSVVVTPEQIYNEFSSGSQDVTAIRDFMKMLYDREDFGEKPGYLLLFGDGSYDYKHRIPENTNVVPTYESNESLTETGSFVTDDYFGLLDDYEGGSASGELDLGIGRFPVSTVQQAKIAVDKVENYLTDKPAVLGDWRTKICFVADDQDSNLHLDQAEDMSSIADTIHKGLRINKIYSDAFAVQETSSGYRYPDVNTNINNQVEKGTVIMNYTGHGGLIGWSEEMILDVPAINGFSNINNLPVFVTATCEFSRFDNPEFTSAGEYVYLNPHGGAVSLLTTTRLAYAHANIIVNTRIYLNLFKKVNGEYPRLGDLVRLSKKPSNANYLNFVLLGDPALKLAFPEMNVITSTVNNVGIGESVDTVKALSEVTVTGFVADESGNKLTSFNGIVFPTVFDKKVKYTTRGNLGSSSPEDFYLFDKILYKGKASVVNGEFSFSFLVPKDISYAYGFGRINYYAYDTLTFQDAWGDYQELVIGGYDQDAVVDLDGPDMEVYLNEPTFSSGDQVTSQAVLYAQIMDPSGVNCTGNGLGRDIVMTLDQDYNNSVVLNDYFYLDMDTYKQGIVKYPLEGLTQGMHTLTVKAWDLQNNSSEKIIEFFVDDEAEVGVSDVLNYPNPFSGETRFEFKHNKIGVMLDITINIFDYQGNPVAELHQTSNTGGSGIEPIYWNGTNYNGDVVDDGFYVYRVKVIDQAGNVTYRQQRLMKITM